MMTTIQNITREQLDDLWREGDAIMRMHVDRALRGKLGSLRLCVDEINAKAK